MALMALLIFSALLNYVDRQAVSVVGPLIKADFKISNETYGAISSVFSLCYIFTSALGGMWIDRVGIRRGLFLSTIVWTVAAAAHGLATGFLSLCAFRILLAVGEGPGGASLLKGVRRALPPRFQDTGVSLVGAGTLLGAVLAPLIIGPMADRIGWRAAFVVTAALGLIWLPLWWVVSARPKANMEAEEERSVAARPRQRLDFTSPALWATAVCIFFSIAPSVFTFNFLPIFLSETYGKSVTEISKLTPWTYLAMDVGQILGGYALYVLLARGFSPLASRRIVMTLGFLGALTMLMMVQAPDLNAALLWLNLSRFSFQFAYSALLAYGISAVPESQGGAMNGFMNAIFGLCTFVFSLLIGRVADKLGFHAVLIMVGVMPLVALVGWWVLSSMAERRASPTPAT
jgi:ACS family hexuronate transporter-like MFS transporter